MPVKNLCFFLVAFGFFFARSLASSPVKPSEELLLKSNPIAFYDYGLETFVLFDNPEFYYVYNTQRRRFESVPFVYAADSTFHHFLKDFFPVSLRNGKTFFVHEGGGVVYELKNDSLVRHDKSFYHRNQYGGALFAHQNTIYMYGGYGMFVSKNVLVRYDELLREWVHEEAENAGPPAVKVPIACYTKNRLYVFGLDEAQDEPTSFAFVYNFTTSNWQDLGQLSDEAMELLYVKGHFWSFLGNRLRTSERGVMNCKPAQNQLIFTPHKMSSSLKSVHADAEKQHYLLMYERSGTHAIAAKVVDSSDFWINSGAVPMWVELEQVNTQRWQGAAMGMLLFLTGAMTGYFLSRYRTRRSAGRLEHMGQLADCAFEDSKQQALFELLCAAPDGQVDIHSINELIASPELSYDALKKRREKLTREFRMKLAVHTNLDAALILQETKNPEDKRMKMIRLNPLLFDQVKNRGK
jgi:hypothetical protein